MSTVDLLLKHHNRIIDNALIGNSNTTIAVPLRLEKIYFSGGTKHQHTLPQTLRDFIVCVTYKERIVLFVPPIAFEVTVNFRHFGRYILNGTYLYVIINHIIHYIKIIIKIALAEPSVSVD